MKARGARLSGHPQLSAIMYFMYINAIKIREIDVTALIDDIAVMYNPGMTEPKLDKDLPIFKARNQLAEVIEKARYFDGVTYLTNRGKRVAAVVPVEVAERYEAEQAASGS